MQLSINSFLNFVGNYRIAGFFPLDILAHLLVSIIVTVTLRRKKYGYSVIFLTMLVLGISKEYYDSFVMNSHILEHTKDMIMNLIYPTISYGIYKIKKK
jgi:hypothetical protein